MPQVVLQTIQQSDATYEWFINEWVHLVVIHPETRELYTFKAGSFSPYQPFAHNITTISDITPEVEAHQENLPVYLLS